MDVPLDRDTAHRLAELAQATHRPQGELAAQLLKNYLNDLQDWKAEAIGLGLQEADADQLTDLEQVRQRWEDKRARHTDAER
ncbi:MAG: ribbon-helix-helix protein, CopG family [Gammaproteobacteria bacterium]|nr:ribbon-helix-helix protein, CopG family [Gammaproteobacteria bacterium]